MSERASQAVSPSDPRRNPFFVLGLASQATATEIEREGRKLIAQLEVGSKKASTYSTPWGPMARTVDVVREAMVSLRDPQTRFQHEVLLPKDSAVTAPRDVTPPASFDAFEVLGWNLPR